MRRSRMTGVALATMAMVAAPAGAKTITLHYFAKEVGVRLTNAAGRAVNRHTRPRPGFSGDEVGLAYVGNHKRHAGQWTASYHLRCVFGRSKRPTCDGQIAIGGSMLLLSGIRPNFQANSNRLAITGGTGAFQRARGSVRSDSVGNSKNSDFTITVSNLPVSARGRVL